MEEPVLMLYQDAHPKSERAHVSCASVREAWAVDVEKKGEGTTVDSREEVLGWGEVG